MSRIQLRCHGATHTGNVREANEDTLMVDDRLGLFCVFDGMGGHMAGDVASNTARDVVHAFVGEHRGRLQPRELMVQALNAASAAVHHEAKNRRDRHGMGTTAVCVLMTSPTTAVLAHVGDSRAYLLRDRRMQLLTHDHTVVAELIANGAISAEEAKVHPYKSVLSRNLGAKPQTRADVADLILQPGDKLLLCSDGLTGFAPHDAVEQILGGADSAENAAGDLVQLALRGGGGDNVTVVVVDLGRKPVPRSTMIVRQTGSASWWHRRPMFLAAAGQRGLASSPICAVLSRDEAVHIVAGNLCEAIYHDLENGTGINVWTYAENLARGWLEQGGSYDALRGLLDILRASALDVLANIAADGVSYAAALETQILRAFSVAEMAVAGQLAARLAAIEAQLVDLKTKTQTDVGPPRAVTDQATVPYMRAMKVDPPSPAVVHFLDQALAAARAQLQRLVDKAGASTCLGLAHRVCGDSVGDASLAARELFAGRTLEEQGITNMLEDMETARAVHIEALKSTSGDRPVRAAALRRVCNAHQRIYCAVARLIVDAGRPISDSLHAAAERTAQLRTRLGQGEARLAKMERMMATSVDLAPPGWKQ